MTNKGDPGKPKTSAPAKSAGGGAAKKESRRRVAVEGEAEPAKEEAAPRPKKIPQRSLQDILGDPKKGAEEGEPPPGPVWDPARLEQFLRGRITLADLEGITKPEQYEMAKIGFSYLSSGKLAQAKTVFEGLVALDPYDAYFHTALGSIAQQQNKLPEAEARYSRALEINPFSPVALANRGEVRVLSGKLAEGAQDLLRALEEDPNAVQPSTIRARATIQVVREQLTSMNITEAPPAAAQKGTGSKVPVAAKKDAPSPAPAKPAQKAPAAAPAKAAPATAAAATTTATAAAAAKIPSQPGKAAGKAPSQPSKPASIPSAPPGEVRAPRATRPPPRGPKKK